MGFPKTIVITVALIACTRPVRIEKMVPEIFDRNVPVVASAGFVSTEFLADATAKPAVKRAKLGPLEVAAFQAAVATSIRQSGLFTTVAATPDAASHQLDVRVVRLLYQPGSVQLTVNWRLTALGTGQVLAEKLLTNSNGLTRIGGSSLYSRNTPTQLLVEGAVRENISMALAEIHRALAATERRVAP